MLRNVTASGMFFRFLSLHRWRVRNNCKQNTYELLPFLSFDVISVTFKMPPSNVPVGEPTEARSYQ